MRAPFSVAVLRVAPCVALNCPAMVEEAAVAKPPVRVARPFAVRVWKSAPLVALNCPPMVVEPVETMVWKVPVELTVREPVVSVPTEAVCAKRLVDDAVVAKELVEVAKPRSTFPVALKAPDTVEEPVMARELVVPLPKEKDRPVMRPVFDMEKSELTVPALVVEEIWKSVVVAEVEATWMERSAKGEVVAPRPMPLMLVIVSKREVEEAKRPWVRKSGVEVEFTFKPKAVVGVNGKAE